MTSETWIDRGACRGLDPAMFFPELGQGARAAKAVCADCPVKAECLDYSQRIGPVDGVWGGLTVKERRRLRTAEGATKGAPVNLARYAKAAAVAVKAHDAGLVPAHAVADALRITPHSARGVIRKARQLGHHIPPLYNCGSGSRVQQ